MSKPQDVCGLTSKRAYRDHSGSLCDLGNKTNTRGHNLLTTRGLNLQSHTSAGLSDGVTSVLATFTVMAGVVRLITRDS